MLPAIYQLPAALVLLLAGILSCFFGYRLFRLVLAVFGFIAGALMASSVFGPSDTGPMLVAALVGGLVGALIFFLAYFIGIALAGAALGATVANLAYPGDQAPSLLVIVICSTVGAVAAMYLQRYVIIVATAFTGAWTMLLGAMSIAADSAARRAAAGGGIVWIPYPLDPAPGQRWVPIVALVLGLVGVGVQLGITGGDKGRVGRRKKK
jgi:hypothetical protein